MNTVNQRIIKNKLGLLNLTEELGNISKACKVMGLSRDTFYRYQLAVADGGVEALLDKTRRKPNIKNRVEEHVEQAVFVSSGGVRCIWLRHGLESLKKRLSRLELKAANEGFVLTESQLASLEKKQDTE